MNTQQERKALTYALAYLKSAIPNTKESIAQSERSGETPAVLTALLYEQERDRNELQSLLDELL